MGTLKVTVHGGGFKTLKGQKKGIFSKRYIHRGPESVVVSEKIQPLPGLCVFKGFFQQRLNANYLGHSFGKTKTSLRPLLTLHSQTFSILSLVLVLDIKISTGLFNLGGKYSTMLLALIVVWWSPILTV